MPGRVGAIYTTKRSLFLHHKVYCSLAFDIVYDVHEADSLDFYVYSTKFFEHLNVI